MASATHLQIDRCHMALKTFACCIKERRWNKVAKCSERINEETELLRECLAVSPHMDDELASQLKYLDIQLRRQQRHLSIHMQAISADVEMLEHGISQAKAAKSLLQELQ